MSAGKKEREKKKEKQKPQQVDMAKWSKLRKKEGKRQKSREE